MPLPFPYQIYPLGDRALTIDFGNKIDEAINSLVIAAFKKLQKDVLPTMIEAVPAYSTLAIYYQPAVIKKMYPSRTAFQSMKQLTEAWLNTFNPEENNSEQRKIEVPVWYYDEFKELIEIHTSREYRVYMLGFLPGFAYMGEVDERIALPRKPQPEMVLAGSVGIAGKQTGVYPFASPGGWQIIGRTPLQLFRPLDISPTLFQAGDKVKFYSISKDEFDSY